MLRKITPQMVSQGFPASSPQILCQLEPLCTTWENKLPKGQAVPLFYGHPALTGGCRPAAVTPMSPKPTEPTTPHALQLRTRCCQRCTTPIKWQVGTAAGKQLTGPGEHRMHEQRHRGRRARIYFNRWAFHRNHFLA